MHPVTPLDRIADAPIDTDVLTTNLKTLKKTNDSASAHITEAQTEAEERI